MAAVSQSPALRGGGWAKVITSPPPQRNKHCSKAPCLQAPPLLSRARPCWSFKDFAQPSTPQHPLWGGILSSGHAALPSEQCLR